MYMPRIDPATFTYTCARATANASYSLNIYVLPFNFKETPKPFPKITPKPPKILEIPFIPQIYNYTYTWIYQIFFYFLKTI